MDERKIITNAEEEHRAVNPEDKSPEEAPTSKEASVSNEREKEKETDRERTTTPAPPRK